MGSTKLEDDGLDNSLYSLFNCLVVQQGSTGEIFTLPCVHLTVFWGETACHTHAYNLNTVHLDPEWRCLEGL